MIAHIDSGINPYARVFRDTSARASTYPGTYIPGYPAGAERLDLTLDAPTWDQAFAKDKHIWDKLLADWNTDSAAFSKRLFWIPGTKIIAAKRFSPGGTFCPPVAAVSPAPWEVNQCTDYPLLDDFGHGTMTATRMAGNRGSLCPECRIVSVEGLGDVSVKWVADQGWIDVQTNSWAFIAPHQAIYAADFPGETILAHLEEAASKMLVYFATGNGLDGALGWAPCPTQDQTTLVAGAIWVGAHDNGKVAPWSCAPAQVVADGYGGLTAGNHSIDAFGPSAFACCTSAASPYAAGEGAQLILDARRMLNDTSSGFHSGVAARGAPPAGMRSGPLAHGTLTLDALRDLVRHTAEARPRAGRDDGAIHWVGGTRAPDPTSEVLPYGPGANAFCNGCWTLPVDWTSVPADVPAYVSIGYGAINERSLAAAEAVLNGAAAAPDRGDVDQFFVDDARVRRVVQHPEGGPPAVSSPQGCIMTSPILPVGQPTIGVDHCSLTLSGVRGEFIVAAQNWEVKINGAVAFSAARNGPAFAVAPDSIPDGSHIDAFVTNGVMIVGNGTGV